MEQRLPTILSREEVAKILTVPQHLKTRALLMTIYATGVRRSEAAHLRVNDIDSARMTITVRGKGQKELNVERSIYLRNVGNCKSEASRKPVPPDAHVAADLWLWKEASTFSKSEDWIFASPHTKGKYPFWPDVLLLKIIQRAARRARD
jgi:integrase